MNLCTLTCSGQYLIRSLQYAYGSWGPRGQQTCSEGVWLSGQGPDVRQINIFVPLSEMERYAQQKSYSAFDCFKILTWNITIQHQLHDSYSGNWQLWPRWIQLESEPGTVIIPFCSHSVWLAYWAEAGKWRVISEYSKTLKNRALC